MKSKHSRNKWMRIVTLPIRVLRKARDFYVRSMIRCAEGTTYGGHVGGTLPKCFSARSTSSGDDDYSELIRAASVRSMGHLNEIDMLLRQHMQMRSNGNSSFPKSCSVGMAGFMGRIEEEDEDASVHPKPSVYPRSISVTVAL